jgi:hypothetical protein
MNLQGIPNSALFYDGFTYDVFGISYQPGRSQEFEILKHRSLMEVYPVTLPLYRRTSSVGPYDLGVVPEPVRMLEISKDGQTEGVFPWGADQQQVFLLDGHLIVLSYTHPEYWFMCGCLPPPRLTLVVLEGNGLWRPANEPKVFEDLWSRGCTVHGAAVHREDLFRATLTSNATRDTWTWTGTCPQEDASGLTALPKSVVLRWHPERRFFDAVAQ